MNDPLSSPEHMRGDPASWQTTRLRDFLMLVAIGWGVIGLLCVLGAVGLVEAFMAVLTIGAGGLAYYVGTAPRRDLTTARPRVPKKIDAGSDPRLGAILSAIKLPALFVDAEGRLAAHNEAAGTVFQIPQRRLALASAVLRRPDLLTSIDLARSRKVRRTIELIMPLEAEKTWLCDIAHVEALDGVLILMSDHTAVKRAERARADFLANASHELRTPLTSLAGFIETMQGPARDDKASWDRFLNIMHDQADRMNRLIDDLLSLSRIELDEHRRPNEAQDFAAIVRDTVDTLRPVAAERGVHLVLNITDEPVWVTAIRDEIIQVVQNLTHNAMKYSPDNGTVTLSIGAADGPDAARNACTRQWDNAGRISLYTPPIASRESTVWLRIEDSGPGIDPEHLPRLGERFYRADKSRGGKITGTGLGLAIVKHIMARHDGGLALESQPGIGSAFGVWLLRREVEPQTTATVASH